MHMKVRYLVSFEITTELADLAELSTKLGPPPGPSSHEKGKHLRTGEPTPTIWKLESEASRDASLEEHLDSVFSQLATVDHSRFATLPNDSDLYLNIAVLTYNPMASITVPTRFLEWMRAVPMDLVSVCYFCEDEEN